MKFEKVYMNNVLTVGEACYFEHKEYVYKGQKEDDKHVIERETKDGMETKYIDREPNVPQIPLNTYVGRKYRGEYEYGEIVGYTDMLQKMYYRINLYSNVFKGYELETLEELNKSWELIEDNPYMDNKMISELTEPIDDELSELEIKIDKLQKEMKELQGKRKIITSKCKHKWFKEDEEEYSKNSFQQQCICELCGEETTNYFSRF